MYAVNPQVKPPATYSTSTGSAGAAMRETAAAILRESGAVQAVLDGARAGRPEAAAATALGLAELGGQYAEFAATAAEGQSVLRSLERELIQAGAERRAEAQRDRETGQNGPRRRERCWWQVRSTAAARFCRKCHRSATSTAPARLGRSPSNTPLLDPGTRSELLDAQSTTRPGFRSYGPARRPPVDRPAHRPRSSHTSCPS